MDTEKVDTISETFDLIVPISSSSGTRTWRSVSYYVSQSNALMKGPTERFLSPEKSVLEEVPYWFPITLIGPPMTGKQAWIEGVCGCWLKNHPRQKSMILTAEDFHRQYRNAMLSQTVSEFQERFRSLNFLCMTGLHFLMTFPESQRELAFIIDQLSDRGVPILFSANEDDCLSGWYGPLFTRIQGGMLIKTQPPDEGLRQKYAVDLLGSLGFAANDIPVIVDWLMMRDHTSITALRAEILQIKLGYSHRTVEPFDNLAPNTNMVPSEPAASEDVNIDIAMNTDRIVNVDQLVNTGVIAGEGGASELTHARLKEWAEQKSEDETPLELKDIVKQTAREFGLTLKELCGQSRRKTNVTARGVVVHLSRKLGGFTYEQIGKQLNGRDHTTISHAARVFSEKMQQDPDIGKRMLKIERALK